MHPRKSTIATFKAISNGILLLEYYPAGFFIVACFLVQKGGHVGVGVVVDLLHAT